MSHRLALAIALVFLLAGGAAACAHEVNGGPGVATTTSAAVGTDVAVRRMAASRCRRAAECNRVGAGQMYTDNDECLDRSREEATPVAASCTNGIDPRVLDECISSLESQHCDADLGRVTALDYCTKYCQRMP